ALSRGRVGVHQPVSLSPHRSHEYVARKPTSVRDNCFVFEIAVKGFDCFDQGVDALLVEQHARNAWHNRLERSAASKGDDGPAARHRLDGNDAEILFTWKHERLAPRVMVAKRFERLRAEHRHR